MPIILPFDILFRIVQVFFEDTPRLSHRGDTTFGFKKPTWKAIENLLSTSRVLRRIGLRMWFTRLRVEGERNWDLVTRMSEFYNWVQEIAYQPASAMLIPSLHPNKFPFLMSVSVYTVDIHIRRPHMLLQRIPDSLQILELQCLNVADHQRLLAVIAKQFPRLQELRLRSLIEAQYSGLASSEPPLCFATSVSLQLKPLTKLRKLLIDLYLTPSSIHFHHASYHNPTTYLSCQNCIQKYYQQTRVMEAEASLTIAKELPDLQWIQWLSYFSADQCSRFYVQVCHKGHVTVKPDEKAGLYSTL